jgi:beta-glucosidase
VYSVDHAINAGLDLEMPGSNKWRTLERVGRFVTEKKVTVRTIKERARKVLELVQKCAKEAPEVSSSGALRPSP